MWEILASGAIWVLSKKISNKCLSFCIFLNDFFFADPGLKEFPFKPSNRKSCPFLSSEAYGAGRSRWNLDRLGLSFESREVNF